MNLPDILNVALGLIILYVLLSSIASLLLDLATGAAHYREEILYVTINRLLAGQPDEPWNITKLVLDRIAHRLPNTWATGWLRRRWMQKFTVAAPPLETVQRFWAHPQIKVFSDSRATQSARESAFAAVILDATSYDEDCNFKPRDLLGLLQALQLSAPTAANPPRPANQNVTGAQVASLVQSFRDELEIVLAERTHAQPDFTVAKFAAATLAAINPEDASTEDAGHPLSLLRALAAKGSRSVSSQQTIEGRPDVVQRFWSHPKIRSLAVPGMEAPPSMQSATFATVVIDITIPRNAQGVMPDNRLELLRALNAPNADTPAPLLNTLRTLGLSSQIAVGATGEALWKPFSANIASWFDEASAGATTVYRRTMQRLLLGLGLLLAFVLNADSIRTIHLLSHDRPLREAMSAYSETLSAERAAKVAAAAQAVSSTPSATAPAAAAITAAGTSQVRELSSARVALSNDIDHLRELDRIGFPIGWSAPDNGFHDADALVAWSTTSWMWAWLATLLAVFAMIFLKFVGLGATALAISQGAPFWYDLMSRVIALRKGQTTPPPSDNKSPNFSTNTTSDARPPVIPPSPLPLEIGHDLAEPATGFNARKAYWLARASAAAYSPEREIEALVINTWKFHECRFFDKNGTQGFCASDDKIVLIAFRGTELKELNDVFDDGNFPLITSTDYGADPLRQVHKGFHGALGRVWNDLNAKILEWTKAKEGRAARQIFITGHSLGGALGTLTFARLAPVPDRPVPTLYTFGCPKVGDKIFASQLDRFYPERIFRVVNDTDIVPRLPPALVPPASGYFHAGHEFTFDKNGKLSSEISGLSRLLGVASKVAATNLETAARQAVDDHGMAYYVAKCKALAEAAT